MIPKEKKDECVARFTQNPYWRSYLDNAPESAKAYIKMMFILARSALWRGVWVSSRAYAAAPEWAKRYCEHNGWVEYVGRGELPDGKDGRKMDYAHICTKMEDADWDFLVKHTHSYARGMAIGMARRYYQHKDIRSRLLLWLVLVGV